MKKYELILVIVLLAISVVLVSYCSAKYLIHYTNFLKQIEIEDLTLSHSLFFWWSIGILTFIIIICFLKDVKKIFTIFIFEVLLVMASALLLLVLLIPAIRFWFKIYLTLSSFIIYYTVYHVKYFWENNKSEKILNWFWLIFIIIIFLIFLISNIMWKWLFGKVA